MRAAALVAPAMAGSRWAKNSCSCSLTRSTGLPSMTENPGPPGRIVGGEVTRGLGLEDLRELQVPVEEPVVLGRLGHDAGQDVSEVTRGSVGDGARRDASGEVDLLGDEGGAPGVGFGVSAKQLRVVGQPR